MNAVPPAPLDRATLEAALAPVREGVCRLELHAEVDSTSGYLAGRALPDDGRAVLCIAERQTAGHGRRGRAWHAPAGGAITFSLARVFRAPRAALGALGLVAGVAMAEALRARGVAGVGLKWPNDLQVGGAKLGGVLVELAGATGGPSRAVVGVGINYDLGASAGAVDQPVTDVVRAAAPPPARAALAGDLMAALVVALGAFAREGPGPFRPRWRGLDVLAGRAVRVQAPGDTVLTGTARGIADDGALVLATDAGARTVYAGDVSVRVVA